MVFGMSENARVETIEKLFHEALAHDDSCRGDFLTAACRGDVVVMAEVYSLLASLERDKDFLVRPAFDHSASEIADSILGDDCNEIPDGPKVKGYVLVREVGSGGMGSVFEAWSTGRELNERVAVKVVKRGMDTHFILRRFERERRILGELEHPYIARMVDGGTTEDGRPYFVMEYVDGRPIDRYVAESALSIGERLELFLKVCDPVSYAHRRRVLHRDLKPSNILVSNTGVPKLLDFGIAKLVDLDFDGRSGDQTATVHRVMTPRHASPEQLSGKPLTEASDVYSLGLLLYILLTGEHPYAFQGQAPNEILQSLETRPARKPSEAITSSIAPGTDGVDVRRELKGNLDTIVLKALRREPERRYESVEQFADDIRLHTQGKKITAGGDSVAYRTKQLLRRNRVYALPIAAVGIVCLVLGLLVGLSGAGAKPRTSVAVMPFLGGGEGSYSDQLADGLTYGLTEQLSRVPQLSVPSHNSVFSYKGKPLDAKTAGQSLGVQTLLTGKIALEDERLSVQVELRDSDSGEILWTKNYGVTPSNLLALQREVVADVAPRLGLTPSSIQLNQSASQQTTNEEAYRLYLLGRYFFNKRRKEDFHKGIEHFNRAIEKDPRYALAYAGLADSYGLLGAFILLSPDEAFNTARNNANKALEIEPNLAEAHTSLALVHWLYDWDWAAADREFRRAIELNPSYVVAHHWRGLFLGEMARFDEAETEMKHAIALDPVSVPVHADYGRVLFWARRYEEALAKYQKVAEMGNDFGSTHLEAKQCYEQMGRVKDWEAVQELSGGFDAEERKAFRADGLRGYWMVQYRRQGGRPGGSDGAELAARVGDKNKAFRDLEDAIRVHDHRVSQLKVNPIFDPLRSDPRFDVLLRRLNLNQ